MTGELEQLVTGADVARMLGLSRQRVQQLAAGDGFPEPLGRVGNYVVWKRTDIEAWAGRARQPLAEVAVDDHLFRTIPGRPGHLDVIEPGGIRRPAVAWDGAPIVKMRGVDGSPPSVVVETARSKGRIAKNIKGHWVLLPADET